MPSIKAGAAALKLSVGLNLLLADVLTMCFAGPLHELHCRDKAQGLTRTWHVVEGFSDHQESSIISSDSSFFSLSQFGSGKIGSEAVNLLTAEEKWLPFFSSKVLSVSAVMGLGRDLQCLSDLVWCSFVRGSPACTGSCAAPQGWSSSELHRTASSSASLLPAGFSWDCREEEWAHP